MHQVNTNTSVGVHLVNTNTFFGVHQVNTNTFFGINLVNTNTFTGVNLVNTNTSVGVHLVNTNTFFVVHKGNTDTFFGVHQVNTSTFVGVHHIIIVRTCSLFLDLKKIGMIQLHDDTFVFSDMVRGVLVRWQHKLITICVVLEWHIMPKLEVGTGDSTSYIPYILCWCIKQYQFEGA